MEGRGTGARLARLWVVLTGIVLAQAALYGPSLLGRKVLLPLDDLAARKMYLPQTAEVARIVPQDPYKLDLLVLFEPARRFAVSEWQHGRVPMWAPYHFAGAPFIWPKFSPFLLLECCTASPVVLAWGQMFAAVVAGLGMYAFCRLVLKVSFWRAAVCAWCYPLTGFFVFWLGYPTCAAAYWFPWLLLTVDSAARGANRFAGVGLSVVTCLVLISGHLDVAGQALLASGVYGLWCVADVRWTAAAPGQALRALGKLGLGWVLGFMLAAPAVLPSVEYAQAGARMALRSAGQEERRPVGVSALPQVVLPDVYGSVQTGSMRLVDGDEMESSAAAYSGIAAVLFLAPLAWTRKGCERANWFWLVFGLLGLSWCLNVPGLVHLLRLPGLNMMSHNRLVFVTGFASLALAATGLEAIRRGEVRWQRWFWLPLASAAGLGGWCVFRTVALPGAITRSIDAARSEGKPFPWWAHGEQDVQRIQSWFVEHYAIAAVVCGVVVVCWAIVWGGGARNRLKAGLQTSGLGSLAAALWVGELLWFGYGRNPQCEPRLYFPKIPVLEQVAKAPAGRVIGFNCLPASVASMAGLRDVRGYDSVDPAAYIGLMGLAADPRSESPDYAQTQWILPAMRRTPEKGIRLAPVLDMLGVRYVIFRGSPPEDMRPAFQGNDYWVMTNAAALPRAFVPKRVEVVEDEEARLRKLGAPGFDAREVGYVESGIDVSGACTGAAEVSEEVPSRLKVSAHMVTAGLLVIADLWDPGWHAYVNGKPTPILRANHALRGVVLPAGDWRLEFRYWPGSLTLGLGSMGAALFGLVLWMGKSIRRPKTEG